MNPIHANFRWISIISACLLLISGCQSPGASDPLPTETKAEIAEVEPTQTATKTPAPTSTNTPIPTDIPTKTPIEVPEGVEVVYMQAVDGSDLIGYLRQPETPIDEGLIVVLAHAWNASHNEWRNFEEVLTDNGIATITFDFPGRLAHGGMSTFSNIGEDVRTVVEQMRERGYERVVCIGSGMGGTACLIGAVNTGVEGLVILSAEWYITRGLITKSDVSNLAMPKLMAFNEQDTTLVGGSWTVEGFHETAELLGEPKEIYVYQGFTSASAMLLGEYGDELQTHILDFVKRIAE